jgi:hypothetical protein
MATRVAMDSNSNHTNPCNGSSRSGTCYCLDQSLSEQLETLRLQSAKNMHELHLVIATVRESI